MKSGFWKRALLAGLSVGVVSAARAEEDPAAFVRRGVEEVMSVAYSQTETTEKPLSERVRPVLEKYFDFEAVTKRAVGPGWRKLSEAERAKVRELFGTLVLRTYVDSFKPGDRPEIQYGTPIKLSETRTEMPTTIIYEGQGYAVSYRMQKTSDSWRVYDVIIEGVSMIANYRAQFTALLQKGGASALINALEENLRKASQKT